MAIDRSVIGRETARASLPITRSRLRNFATATGQSDPVYTDLDAAKQAGHPDLPVPPTFLFGVSAEAPDSLGFLESIGVDLRSVLHGEQQFSYREVAHAGDELSVVSRISDVYEKRGGLLEFLVQDSVVTNQHDTVVAEMRSVLVVQHRAPAATTEENAR
ncbi:MaoC family dehydratase N-terminal domain-containing protein [Saccharopolyspora elongata]|uniref:MaoC family dehydratase n=1 Tax=Saccharopolyspora elongata TaxID=2530387 RepID=A0A4R4XSD1_9PSEU|nr:MaoC family dehydratase N-terminal domain-containing protein [Saccharopolyspora elongata]TDD34206.1 MaoC family dehydratase [Saccharopolyspora elongata]